MQFAYKFSPKKRAILGKFTSKMKFAKKFLTPLGKFLEIPLGAGFLTLEMVKMTLSEGQILTKRFDFRGHISTFRAENKD